ncbi:MAG: hypothetical protein DRJ33_04075 [Candidatus Methanomethylicota archaeon]|uniref:Thioredoxin domain-containing protein n=1 Tax=Thermoproteota archaeon TaxID=2056631 RepID=A0A497F081_9CREN|nr:MAG: hypothetical protein DRJ33_04075 [Candidatus Verstraetearchaeota archaeon]
MRASRKLVLIGLLLIVVMVLSPLYSAFAPKRPGEPGSKAEASVPELAEALSSGKPVVIFFASVNCTPCELLYVYTWIPAVQKYGNQTQFVLLLYSNETHRAFSDYRVYAVPTLIFINKQGIIVERVEGYISFKKFEDIMNSKVLA